MYDIPNKNFQDPKQKHEKKRGTADLQAYTKKTYFAYICYDPWLKVGDKTKKRPRAWIHTSRSAKNSDLVCLH
jgi:hypothetical protein